MWLLTRSPELTCVQQDACHVSQQHMLLQVPCSAAQIHRLLDQNQRLIMVALKVQDGGQVTHQDQSLEGGKQTVQKSFIFLCESQVRSPVDESLLAPGGRCLKRPGSPLWRGSGVGLMLGTGRASPNTDRAAGGSPSLELPPPLPTTSVMRKTKNKSCKPPPFSAPALFLQTPPPSSSTLIMLPPSS